MARLYSFPCPGLCCYLLLYLGIKLSAFVFSIGYGDNQCVSFMLIAKGFTPVIIIARNSDKPFLIWIHLTTLPYRMLHGSTVTLGSPVLTGCHSTIAHAVNAFSIHGVIGVCFNFCQ